jgi:hypothetical protein
MIPPSTMHYRQNPLELTGVSIWIQELNLFPIYSSDVLVPWAGARLSRPLIQPWLQYFKL